MSEQRSHELKVWVRQASGTSAAGRCCLGGGVGGCWLLTLTFLHKAAQVLVLLPDDPLQPLRLVEVGETSQSTEEDWTEQRSHGAEPSPSRKAFSFHAHCFP